MSDRDIQSVDECDGWTVTTDHAFVGMTVMVGEGDAADDELREGRVVSIEEYEGDPTRLNVDVGPTDEEEIINVAPGNERVEVL